MASPTHATLATFRMDLGREEQQREGLEQMIVPGVQRHPGFVAGTWTLDRDAATSYVMLTFASLESAEAMRDNVIPNAENQRFAGIELVDIRLLEVSASAAAV